MSDFLPGDALDNDPDFNPYAAPKATTLPAGEHAVGDGVWRDGPILVMAKIALLPERCVKCNRPNDGGFLKRNLSWHPPAWYLLILVSWIIYLIVYFVVRKTAKIEVPVCLAHRNARRRDIAIGWIASLSGIGLFIYGMQGPEPEPISLVSGLVLFLGGLIYGVSRSQIVAPTKIDEGYVWLKKVGPEYLNMLPNLYEPAPAAGVMKVNPSDAFEL